MLKKIGILALVALMVSMVIPTVLATTRTPGYWKNPKKSWAPVTELEIGGVPYSQEQLYVILETPVKGRVWYNLAPKVIAMKLSIAVITQGSAQQFILDLLTDADAWLAADNDRNEPPNTVLGQEGIAIAAELDYWLNFWNVG